MIEDPPPQNSKSSSFLNQPSVPVPQRFWVGIVLLGVISVVVLILVAILVVLGSKEIDPNIVKLPDGRMAFVGLMKKYPGKDMPAVIKELAETAWDRWEKAFIEEGYTTKQKAIDWMTETSMNMRALPLTIVSTLVSDGALLGSVKLDANDMSTHPEMFPWVADLLVLQKKSSKLHAAIFSALMQKLLRHAHKLGHACVYVWTEDKDEFAYTDFGFQEFHKEEYCGEMVDMLVIGTNSSATDRCKTAALKNLRCAKEPVQKEMCFDHAARNNEDVAWCPPPCDGQSILKEVCFDNLAEARGDNPYYLPPCTRPQVAGE